jgi:choline-glycine betaine transporter
MREFVRHFAFTVLAFFSLIALMAGTFVWMSKSESMRSEFSPTACQQDGGKWDHAVDLCRRY